MHLFPVLTVFFVTDLSIKHLNVTEMEDGNKLHLYISWPMVISICEFRRYAFIYRKKKYFYDTSLEAVNIKVPFATFIKIDVRDTKKSVPAFTFNFTTIEGGKYYNRYQISSDCGASNGYVVNFCYGIYVDDRAKSGAKPVRLFLDKQNIRFTYYKSTSLNQMEPVRKQYSLYFVRECKF